MDRTSARALARRDMAQCVGRAATAPSAFYAWIGIGDSSSLMTWVMLQLKTKNPTLIPSRNIIGAGTLMRVTRARTGSRSSRHRKHRRQAQPPHRPVLPATRQPDSSRTRQRGQSRSPQISRPMQIALHCGAGGRAAQRRRSTGQGSAHHGRRAGGGAAHHSGSTGGSAGSSAPRSWRAWSQRTRVVGRQWSFSSTGAGSRQRRVRRLALHGQGRLWQRVFYSAAARDGWGRPSHQDA